MGVTRIQHNLSAMNAMSNYQGNQNTLTGNLEKLSSGYRINSAADDAAGLAISEKMRSQIAGLEKAQDNANDGISLIQTAEGALTEVNSMLTRLKTLATQSANGTYDDGVDRANLQEETDALLEEIDRISQSTNFNGINLLDGSMSNAGIKQTVAAVNVNGISLSETKSEDGVATQYKVSISNGDDSVEGDTQTFKFSFKDEQGEDKSASISFTTGSDGVASVKNLAEAINKNATLGTHFTASVNDDNDLILTSTMKAAAATGSDITTGAASISNVANVSENANISIDKQSAVGSYSKLSDKLYSEDGTELKSSRQIANAVESGQKLYTNINADGNAGVASNEVTNSDLDLTAAASNLTSDTTFTLTKGAALDATHTSAKLQGVELTDEGKAIQNDTVFTFTAASATSASSGVGTVTLKNKSLGMTSDVTFTFTSAKASSYSDGIVVQDLSSSNTTAVSAKSLTSDTTFTFTAAAVSSNGTSGVDKDQIELTDKARQLTNDTTFTFTASSVTSSSAGLGTVMLQDAGKQLATLGSASTTTDTITFKYTAATVNKTSTVGGVNIGSGDLTATSLAKSLTEDYVFEFNGSSWMMYRANDEDGIESDDAKSVSMESYFSNAKTNSNIDLTNTTNGTPLQSGDKIYLDAGYWQLSTSTAGLETNATDASGNEIINVGDGSKYFTFSTSNSMAGGEEINIRTSSWSASGGVSGSLTATSAQEYFRGSNATETNAAVKIKASYWTSSNKSLAKTTSDGTLTSAEATNYIGTVASLGATETGQYIKVTAAHWQANDSALGNNGNVGNGKEYFTTTNSASGGDSITVTGGNWTATGGISGQVDINKYFEGTEDVFKTGQQVGVKVSGEWMMYNTNDEGDPGESVNISDYFSNDLSDVNLLESGDIKIKASSFTVSDEDEAVKGTDYTATADQTASKSYDLSTLNDGDRIQINGSNYTYRANEADVQSATDFHTGAQLASMSQAISMGSSTDVDGNGLNDIKVKDQFNAGEALSLQVGDTNKDYQKVGVTIQDMSSKGLGLSGLDVSTQEGAAEAIDLINTAVNTVSTQRGKLGALQNRLDHTLNNLDATTQNITAAESQIRDVDMAKEMTQYSKNNILVQAAQSMLAQANSLPQGVLSLLQ